MKIEHAEARRIARLETPIDATADAAKRNSATFALSDHWDEISKWLLVAAFFVVAAAMTMAPFTSL